MGCRHATAGILGVTQANFGWGVISGGGIAIIAMITDRIIQAWSRRKKQELGIA